MFLASDPKPECSLSARAPLRQPLRSEGEGKDDLVLALLVALLRPRLELQQIARLTVQFATERV